MTQMNKNIRAMKFSLVSLLALSVTGCLTTGGNMAELEQYVQDTVNREPGAIDPIPEFVAYAAFSYSATTLRAPFDVPVTIDPTVQNRNSVRVKPDENRAKEFLEKFSIGTLTMVGSMARNSQTWVLLQDEESGINRVTVGNYIGRNHGRIISVDTDHINVVEIVPDGDGGWIERPQMITLVAEL